jgi:hypothetical protein
MPQIKSLPAEVNHGEVRGEIFLAEDASVRFPRGLQKENVAGDVSHRDFGVSEFKTPDSQFFDSRATQSSV